MRWTSWIVVLAMVGACGRAGERAQRIVLERPWYQVTVMSDGRIHYDGSGVPVAFVGDTGPLRIRHDSGRISRAKADSVLAAFDHAWSRWRPNHVRFGERRCGDAGYDFGSIVIVRQEATRRDTMEAYLGCEHVPERIVRLGAYIDSVAEVEWWLLADPAAFRYECAQSDSGLTVAAHRCTPRDYGASRR